MRLAACSGYGRTLVLTLFALVLSACNGSSDSAGQPTGIGTPPNSGVSAPPSPPPPPPAPSPPAPSPPAPTVDAPELLLDSFAVIEFQYDSLPGFYFYVPLIHVSSTGGTVLVTKLQLTFPDGSVAPTFCSAGMQVTTSGRNLVGEIYGDYELTFDLGGRRASEGDFSVLITYVKDDGQRGYLVATGPIVPGFLPATYTGGTSSMLPVPGTYC
jgi:hypothetical protein